MLKNEIELKYSFDRHANKMLIAFYEKMSPPISVQNDFFDEQHLTGDLYEDSSDICKGFFSTTKGR
jgi:hypothetical protein